MFSQKISFPKLDVRFAYKSVPLLYLNKNKIGMDEWSIVSTFLQLIQGTVPNSAQGEGTEAGKVQEMQRKSNSFS